MGSGTEAGARGSRHQGVSKSQVTLEERSTFLCFRRGVQGPLSYLQGGAGPWLLLLPCPPAALARSYLLTWFSASKAHTDQAPGTQSRVGPTLNGCAFSILSIKSSVILYGATTLKESWTNDSWSPFLHEPEMWLTGLGLLLGSPCHLPSTSGSSSFPAVFQLLTQQAHRVSLEVSVTRGSTPCALERDHFREQEASESSRERDGDVPTAFSTHFAREKQMPDVSSLTCADRCCVPVIKSKGSSRNRGIRLHLWLQVPFQKQPL